MEVAFYYTHCIAIAFSAPHSRNFDFDIMGILYNTHLSYSYKDGFDIKEGFYLVLHLCLCFGWREWLFFPLFSLLPKSFIYQIQFKTLHDFLDMQCFQCMLHDSIEIRRNNWYHRVFLLLNRIHSPFVIRILFILMMLVLSRM